MTDTHRVSRAARHGASARSQKCRLRTRREGASVRDSPRLSAPRSAGAAPPPTRASGVSPSTASAGTGVGGQQAPPARPPQTSAWASPHCREAASPPPASRRGAPGPLRRPGGGLRPHAAHTQRRWAAGVARRSEPKGKATLGLAVALRACSHTRLRLRPLPSFVLDPGVASLPGDISVCGLGTTRCA